MEQDAEDARRDFAGRFINGNDATGMQRTVAFLFSRENLVLGMHHPEITRIGIEFDFSVQRDLLSRREYIRQVGPVKPFTAQHSS